MGQHVVADPCPRAVTLNGPAKARLVLAMFVFLCWGYAPLSSSGPNGTPHGLSVFALDFLFGNGFSIEPIFFHSRGIQGSLTTFYHTLKSGINVSKESKWQYLLFGMIQGLKIRMIVNDYSINYG